MGKFTSRYIEDAIKNICFSHGKMAFISGPRQCGKTTMAKNLLNERHAGEYYNWDETVFRRIWSKNPQDLIKNLITENNVKPLLVLDEIHKANKIQPFSKSLPRSLKKESKMYLWDWSEIDNEAARFENMIAAHLLKYCDYLSDTGEGDFKLHYLRNKEQKEIDFLITKDKKPWLPVEVKLHDTKLSNNWSAFMKYLACEYAIQVVKSPDVYTIETTNFGKVLIISAAQFLSCLV